MGRVIATEKVGQRRHALRRLIAELLRRLMTRQELDAETLDMAATIVFCLRELERGVEQTAQAWERRDYYIKADRFRYEWKWVKGVADELERALLLGDWNELPRILTELAPRFADITIRRYTYGEDVWAGAYQRLQAGEE